jgi:RNase P/RNase MRP subunit p29
MSKMKTVIPIILAWLICADLSSAQERNVKVTLHTIEGYGANQPFAYRAAQLLEDVLNSDEFKEEILEGRFNSREGLSNLQLYQKIMTAHEAEGPGGQDGVVDLRARTLRIDSDERRWKVPCDRRTIGVDGAGTGITAICPQKLTEWATDGRTEYLAAHYAHEYIHMLGFHHNRIPKRSSFVYQVGNIVERLAQKRREAQARLRGETS